MARPRLWCHPPDIMNRYWDEFEKRVKPTFVPVKVTVGAAAMG